MTDANIVIPQPPQGLPDPNDSTKTLPADELQIYVWKDAFTRASKRKDYYGDRLDKAYVIIYNQCSPSLKNELESSNSFPPSAKVRTRSSFFASSKASAARMTLKHRA